MTDDLLTARIHELAAGIDVPTTTPYDDVRRGRRRERRRRAGLTAGAVATVAAAGVGWTAVAGGPETARPASEREPAAASSGLTPVTPARLGPGDLRDLLHVLEDRAPKPIRLRAIGRAATWEATGADGCRAGWTCEDVQVAGGARARFATDGVVSELVGELPREGVVVLVASTATTAPEELAFDVR
ncbi:hypothetical protein GCM10022237_50970 [Nocardioides ginsengisoli]|uniref:Anti-sigma factor n=1 Tax=Nocardioides ginsengisoli TaxID=363868 RepID=A0ABW3VVG9_9ACTN